MLESRADLRFVGDELRFGYLEDEGSGFLAV
jgi:hypothetical protein